MSVSLQKSTDLRARTLKKALSEHANKDFEPIISPVIRSGFRSASGFAIVFASL